MAEMIGRPGIQDEEIRLASNILMCHQQISTGGFSTGSPSMSQAIIAVWAVVSRNAMFAGRPSVVLRETLLRAFHEALPDWSWNLGYEDMDEISDLFAGGPLRGFMTKVYESGRH